MRMQFVPQGAGQNLFALTQDEITGQRHHHAHGYRQKQNQSGAQAHTGPLSGEQRIDRLSVATLFYGIKQISQQISRHRKSISWRCGGSGVGLPATAGHIHSPCLVMPDQTVKNFLRRQAFVNVDRNGRVAQAQCPAVVSLAACDARRPLQRLRVVRRRMGQAVVIVADE
jgi:hypothetical protein